MVLKTCECYPKIRIFLFPRKIFFSGNIPIAYRQNKGYQSVPDVILKSATDLFRIRPSYLSSMSKEYDYV